LAKRNLGTGQRLGTPREISVCLCRCSELIFPFFW